MIENSFAIGCGEIVVAEDLLKGNVDVNILFIAELFKKKPNLDERDSDVIEAFKHIGVDDESVREETIMRNWINYLEISDVFVDNLYVDLRDGTVLRKVIEKLTIDPNVIDLNRI